MNRFYLLVYLIIIAQAGFGQVANLSPDIKSPNVASLGTFGDIPVSLFTGTPDISIPLIDLKGKDLSLPIVLRYHPGGIKPNQRGGWLAQAGIFLSVLYTEKCMGNRMRWIVNQYLKQNIIIGVILLIMTGINLGKPRI